MNEFFIYLNMFFNYFILKIGILCKYRKDLINKKLFM